MIVESHRCCGARLMVGEKAPAALLMYEKDQRRRIILYIHNDLPEDRPSVANHRRRRRQGQIADLAPCDDAFKAKTARPDA